MQGSPANSGGSGGPSYQASASSSNGAAPADVNLPKDSAELTEMFLAGKLGAPKPAADAVPIEIDPDETFQQQEERLAASRQQSNQSPTQPQGQAPTATAVPSQLPEFKYVKPLPIGGQRDYTGLTNEERQMFAAMSKEAYARLRPLYDYHKKHETEWEQTQAQLNELKTTNEQLKGAQFYEVENGWQLDPEIQPKLQATQNLAGEADFWQAQLVAIDEGKQVQFLEQGPDGKVYVSNPRDPAPADRATILRQMQHAINLHNQAQAETNNLIQNFKARQQAYVNGVEEVRSSIIGKFEQHIAPQREAMLQKFPAIARHKPEVKALADMILITGKLLQDLSEYKRREQAGTLLAPAVASAAPRPQPAVNAPGVTSDPLNAAQRMMRMVGRVPNMKPA